LEIAMSREQHAEFLKSVTDAGYMAQLADAIRKLDANKATATRPSDIAMIFGMIEKMEGGVKRLNATVKKTLSQWLVKQHAKAMARFLDSAARADSTGFSVGLHLSLSS
jgi:hypothetical protein